MNISSNYKRGQKIKIQKTDRFGKSWTEDVTVVAVFPTRVLLDSGDTLACVNA